MKTVFNKGHAAVLTLALLLGTAWVGEAQVFYSVRGLLGDHFSKSESVEFTRVRLNAAQRKTITGKLGYAPEKDEYIFYIARSAKGIDGYALFDREVGQHEYIDFATFFDRNGKVTRAEVVAYREPYGEAIRSKRFRKQFVGRQASSGFRPGRDIDVITGATLSARAMAKAVRRASVLLDDFVLTHE